MMQVRKWVLLLHHCIHLVVSSRAFLGAVGPFEIGLSGDRVNPSVACCDTFARHSEDHVDGIYHDLVATINAISFVEVPGALLLLLEYVDQGT